MTRLPYVVFLFFLLGRAFVQITIRRTNEESLRF